MKPAALPEAGVVKIKKIYGLQGFVRGPFTKIGNTPDNTVYSWPHLLMAELLVFVTPKVLRVAQR